MGIKQFSGVWIELEDRILFRVNTTELTEYRFWFTQLILRNMKTLCDQTLKKIYSQKDLNMSTVRREAIKAKVKKNLHQAKFNSGFAFPLGEKPLLVKSVELFMDIDSKKTKLQFETRNQKKIDLMLGVDLLIVLSTLLDQLEVKSGWAQSVQRSLEDTEDNEIEIIATHHANEILH